MVPEMFHEQVVAPGGAAGAWVVLFTDATRHDGIAMAPLFAELAGTFGQDRLHFAEVDVVTWPELADHYKVCSLLSWGRRCGAVLCCAVL